MSSSAGGIEAQVVLRRKFRGMLVANVLEAHFLRSGRTDVMRDDGPDSALRTIAAGA